MRLSTATLSPRLVAVLTGVAIPSLVLGRAVMAVPLAVAVILLAFLPDRKAYARAVIAETRTVLGVLVIVTLALWLPNIVQSPFPLRSLEAWVRIPVFVGLIAMLGAFLADDRDARVLAYKTLLVATAASAVFALSALTFLPEILAFQRMSGWSAMPYEGFRPHDILKSFGSTTALLLPVVVLAGHRLGDRWRVVGVALAVACVAIVWFTYNRSAMAGLLAMLVVAAGLVMAMRRNLVLNLVVAAGVVAILVAVTVWLYETRGWIEAPHRAGIVAVLPPWLVDYQRQTMWSHAIDLAMRAPWFGNGINTINLLPGAEAPMPGNKLHVIPSHPHNWLVEVFVETGAVGALALVALVAWLCFSEARDYLRERDGALLAALMVNVGYWGSGLLNFSFWSAWWQLCYLVLMAFCLAARGPAQSGAPAAAGEPPAAP